MIKVADEIRAKLAEIEADERLHSKPASVQVNVVLALIQVDLAAKANMLRWVLGLPYKQYWMEKTDGKNKRLTRKAQTTKRTP